MSGDVPSPHPLTATNHDHTWSAVFQPSMPYGVTVSFQRHTPQPSMTVRVVSQVYAQQVVDDSTIGQCNSSAAIANLMETLVNQNLLGLQEHLLQVAMGIDEHLRRGRGG